MTTALQGQYQALLDKITVLGERQKQTFGEQIRCKVGCYSCCRPPDSFFQVEAETLRGAVASLSEQAQAKVSTQLFDYISGSRELCPLLDEDQNGACLVYESRPSICRTHGFAISVRSDDEQQDSESTPSAELSWCELNFTEVTPSRELAFDVERLNMMLSLITQLGWKDQPARKGLIELLKEGLAK